MIKAKKKLIKKKNQTATISNHPTKNHPQQNFDVSVNNTTERMRGKKTNQLSFN